MIKTLNIANFRGIEEVKNLHVGKFNIFIGDNGTSKTSILKAINFSFSPSFLSGKIKHTDFRNGSDSHITVLNVLGKSITVSLPDGFTSQNVMCNAISLRAKKRDKKSPGKVFSDLVPVEHIVLPDFAKGASGWSIKRKAGGNFNFTERLLAVSQVSTDELPRSFYFGKNRDRQLSKGFSTSFSTIIDDLNWRFSRSVRQEAEKKLALMNSNLKRDYCPGVLRGEK